MLDKQFFELFFLGGGEVGGYFDIGVVEESLLLGYGTVLLDKDFLSCRGTIISMGLTWEGSNLIGILLAKVRQL
jgi:hypothetical protein